MFKGSPEGREGLRVLMVTGADQLAAKLLKAVVVDGAGTTRVAGQDVYQHEVPAGLAVMASSAHDVVATLPLTPERQQQFIEDFYEDPKLLNVRQQGFLAAVGNVRRQTSERLSR